MPQLYRSVFMPGKCLWTYFSDDFKQIQFNIFDSIEMI